jgi:5-methylcytosine-specific restriction endonuclease McrA
MPPVFRARGGQTKREREKEHDAVRGSASQRGYDHRWSKASASHLRDNPLCAYCQLDDRITGATLTDHLYPHKQFEGVFWKREWWVASCAPCHNGMKQTAERRGKAAIDRLAARLGLPIL